VSLAMCQSCNSCRSSMFNCLSTSSESVGELEELKLQLESRRLQFEHVGYISSHWKQS
jgi:hypothetical protein